MANTLVRCDNLCTESLRSSTWVNGWDLPLEKSFMHAITGDKRPTANTTTLISLSMTSLRSCRELATRERLVLNRSLSCYPC